jgi:hypothetical protein
MRSVKPCAATNKLYPLRCSHNKIEYNTDMAKNTTTVNHSDLPCTCTSMDQYVDGLCPGCTEAADRDADLKEHLDESAVREGDDDRFYSGSGESIGDGPDDDSYTQYLNRG